MGKMKRSTVQRQIVLATLRKFHIHPTVEEVYAEVVKTHPNISKATVYRNLHQLAEDREIKQVLLPNDMERYDRRTDQHYHFKCKICSSVLDVDIDYLHGINEAVSQKYNFQIDGHDVVFTGICSRCRKGQTEK